MSENLDLRRLLPWLLVCLCGSFYSDALGAVSGKLSAISGQLSVVGGQPSAFRGSVSAFAHQRLHDFASDKRARLRGIYTAGIGVREATGRNDGPRIREYLRYVGLGEGYAYCAAFVCWALGEAGIENPKNGWSPALFPAKRIVWRKDQAHTQQPSPYRPQPGDVFGIYYANLKRVAHCGFVDRWDGTWCITVEANTGPDNAVTARGDPANPIRAGPSEGVYRKRRLVSAIYCVANWCD